MIPLALPQPRRATVLGGSRIPFARSGGPYAWASGEEQGSAPVDRARLNVAGSSLATGRPFAATGARIVATPAGLLAERDAPGRGLIPVCAAGGQGVTAILERP